MAERLKQEGIEFQTVTAGDLRDLTPYNDQGPLTKTEADIKRSSRF